MSAIEPITSEVTRTCREINALVTKLGHAERKIDEYQRSIGQHIATIKKARPKDWQEIIEARCNLKKSRAYELLAIADGRKTVEGVRAEKAESVRRLRARPLRSGQETATASTKAEPPPATTTTPTGNGAVQSSAGQPLLCGEEAPAEPVTETAESSDWSLSKEEKDKLFLCQFALLCDVDEPVELPPLMDRIWAIETLKTGEARLRAFRRMVEAMVETAPAPSPAQGIGVDPKASAKAMSDKIVAEPVEPVSCTTDPAAAERCKAAFAKRAKNDEERKRAARAAEGNGSDPQASADQRKAEHGVLDSAKPEEATGATTDDGIPEFLRRQPTGPTP
jgi:hypothetical protein